MMTAFEQFMAKLACNESELICRIDQGHYMLSSNSDGYSDGYSEEDGDFQIYDEEGSLFDSY